MLELHSFPTPPPSPQPHHKMNIQFQYIISALAHKPCYSSFREKILLAETLALTLQFLAYGRKEGKWSFKYVIGKISRYLSPLISIRVYPLCSIIKETRKVLWFEVKTNSLKPPSSAIEWVEISCNFKKFGIFPTVLLILATTFSKKTLFSQSINLILHIVCSNLLLPFPSPPSPPTTHP